MFKLFSLSIDDRVNFVKSKHLCFNCLRSDHPVTKCVSKTSCLRCNSRYYTLLHRDSQSAITSLQTTIKSVPHVLLGTAIVRIRDSSDCFQEARGLVSCSAVPRQEFHCMLFTNAIVLHKITSPMPSASLPTKVCDQFKTLPLADLWFDVSLCVDLLIGADLFSFIYDGLRKWFDSPLALHSIYGWVVTGKINADTSNNPVHSLATQLDLDSTLKKFWEVEKIPRKLSSTRNHDDHFCMPSGRYVVPLPFKDVVELGDSYQHSLGRFNALERKLNRNSSLRHDYSAFMKLYEDLGHFRLQVLHGNT